MLLRLLFCASLLFAAISFHYFSNIDEWNVHAQEDNSSRATNQGNLSLIPEDLIWNNKNKEKVSLSTETSDPISGNGSLRADIILAKTAREANSSWSIITTTPIPVKSGVHYSYSLEISTKDVNQLHSKVYYLDANKREIESKFVFGGQDGTFKNNFTEVFTSPDEAKYHQFQLWVRPSSGINSTFLLDNLDLGQNHTYHFEGNITLADQIIDPVIVDNDGSFKVERIYTGLKFPTSMYFLDNNDILVLEKNDGTVKRIINGNMIKDPLLDVNVANKAERGMLGIAAYKQEVGNNLSPKIYVFLYYTESRLGDGEDAKTTEILDVPGQGPLGNRVYRYELVDNKLINPKLLLDLPAEPKPYHQGGVIMIGPDKNLYVIIGDVDHFTQAQNYNDAQLPDGTGGVLRITVNGTPVGNGIIGETYPLNLYYAYGIRNSFGMDFDPLTGNLWDTENGLRCCDELNLVREGFNSGWDKVQGFWKTNQDRDKDVLFKENSGDMDSLINFNGSGKYSSPKLVWDNTMAPSAIKFLSSDKFGKEYQNDLFVGNVNDQTIYHFDLSSNREELVLSGNLSDRISESNKDLKSHVFGEQFGRITDIEVGPDGNLYVLSHLSGGDKNFRNGSIFKISKSGN